MISAPFVSTVAPPGLAHAKLSLFHGWQQIFLQNYLAQFFQYIVIAGVAFVVFYALLRGLFLNRKIQSAFPPYSDMRREIFYSLTSIAVFAAVGMLAISLKRMGWTHIYFQVEIYGWPYFFFSVAALIILHDTWFYWTHRFMHWRPVFRLAHRVHHQSRNPTPWAAFSFHPIEAFIEAIMYPLVALFMPIHPLAAFLWLLYMMIMNVGGHLGFEFFPKGFASHWLFRWHNTSVHHNMHHSHIHCNYGLYFNIWDRLMGTNHVRYEEHFDRIAGQG